MPSLPSVAWTISRSISPPGYLRVASSCPLDGFSATGIPSSSWEPTTALQKVVAIDLRCPRGVTNGLGKLTQALVRGVLNARDHRQEIGVGRLDLVDDVIDG